MPPRRCARGVSGGAVSARPTDEMYMRQASATGCNRARDDPAHHKEYFCSTILSTYFYLHDMFCTRGKCTDASCQTYILQQEVDGHPCTRLL